MMLRDVIGGEGGPVRPATPHFAGVMGACPTPEETQ